MCNSKIYFTLIGYKAFCLSVQRERERERAPVNRASNCWHLVAGCLIGWYAVGIKIFCRKKDGDSNKEQATPEGGGSVVSCCFSSWWVSEAHVPQPLLQLKVLWGREEDAFATQQDKPYVPFTCQRQTSQKRFMISWVLLLAWIKVLCCLLYLYLWSNHQKSEIFWHSDCILFMRTAAERTGGERWRVWQMVEAL